MNYRMSRYSLGVLMFSVLSSYGSLFRPGLEQGRFNKSTAWTDAFSSSNIPIEMTAGSIMADTTGSATDPISGKSYSWADNRTYVYRGRMYFEGGVTYRFGKYLDDGARLWIDGSQKLDHQTWNTFGSCTFTSSSSGWHTIELRLSNGSGGRGPLGKEWGSDLGFAYNTEGVTGLTPKSAWHPLRDPGDGSLLRVVSDDSFLTLSEISQVPGGFELLISSSAPVPTTATIYLGSTAGAAERSEGWETALPSVALDANDEAVVFVPWSGTSAPFYTISLTGNDGSVFYEWTDITQITMTPAIAAEIASLASDSASFSVSLSYPVSIAGMTPPAMQLKMAYGTNDGGTDEANWDQVVLLGEYGVGTQTPALSNLEADTTYYVAFIVDNTISVPQWTEPIVFSTSGLSLSIPEEAYENNPATLTLTVSRSANDTALPLVVHLAYSGSAYPEGVTELPTSITIPADQASTTITFTPLDNDSADGDAVLTVSLAPGSYSIPAQSSVTLTIRDDETAGGADCIWTGAGDGTNWEDPNNWDVGRVPRFVDNAVFASAATPKLSTQQSIRSLVFRTTGAVTISAVAETTPSLTLGGLLREDVEGNEAVHAINVPVSIYAPDGVQCIWNIAGAQKLQLGGNLTLAAGKICLRKEGPGTLEMNYQNCGYTGTWDIFEGRVNCAKGDSFRAGNAVSIGGGNEPAILDQRAKNRIVGNIAVTVLTNGTFQCGDTDSGRLASIHAKVGGRAVTGYNYTSKAYFTGGEIDATGGYWPTSGTPEMHSYACDVMAHMGANMAHNTYNNMDIITEDGNAPIDLWISGDIGQGQSDKTLTKKGAGVCRYSRAMGNQSKFSISAGTWLADNATGSGTGRHNTTVGANATLGGLGICGGVNADKTITVNGTLAPGSIDNVTGEHLYGTLTIGSEDISTDCLLKANSKLRVSLSRLEREPLADALVVHGVLDLSTPSDTLDVVLPESREGLRPGRYVLASATEGIVGSFDTVNVGLGLKVTQDENEIVLNVPDTGTLLFFR